MHGWRQRIVAMLTILTILFSNVDFSTLAEKSEDEAQKP